MQIKRKQKKNRKKKDMENWCGIALTPLSSAPSENHSPVLSHSYSDGEFLLIQQGNKKKTKMFFVCFMSLNFIILKNLQMCKL